MMKKTFLRLAALLLLAAIMTAAFGGCVVIGERKPICTIVFSNGSALTASDVQYSFERLLILANQNTDIPLEVVGGEAVQDFEGADTWMNMGREYERQRIAFCQVEKLHYTVVCCSGPYTNTSTLMKSTGLTLPDFTRLVAEQGVQTAYNLDGGDSSLLFFHGKRINAKPNQSIRKLQDVIYFVSAEGL